VAKVPDLRIRSFEFAVEVMRFCRTLDQTCYLLRRPIQQLVAAAGSVGANVEEAAAAQSRADFISKNHIALKEARETSYWLRLIARSEPAAGRHTGALEAELGEIIAMLIATINTARRNSGQPKSRRPILP